MAILRVTMGGCALVAGQLVLLREARIAFGGNEIALVLGASMSFLAAVLGLAHRRRRGGRTEPASSLLALVWCPLPSLAVARAVPVLFTGLSGIDPTATQDLAQLMAGLALVLVGPGFVAGNATWSLLGRPAGSARAAGFALGACLGGVVVSLATMAEVGSTALLFFAAVAGSALVATPSSRKGRPRRVAVAATFAAAVGLIASGRIEEALTRWSWPGLLAAQETTHGRVVVADRGGGVVVNIEGALAYEAYGTTAEEFAALASLQRPDLRDVLLLGGWVEGLGAEIARYAPQRLAMVEQDGDVLRLARPFLPSRPPLSDVTVAEARAVLGTQRRWDLIVCALPEPANGANSRAYSAEFFARCAAALRDSGVLALRLRTQANVWTPREARRAAAVRAALVASFPHVLILPGTETVFLASAAPLTTDPAAVARHFQRAAPATRVVSEGWLHWRFTNERANEMAALVERAEVPANRDRRPACYADPIMLDLARVFPGIGWRAPPSAGRWLWLALAVSFLPSVFARRRAGPRRDVLAAYAGLAGAGTAAVLLLHDQAGRAMLTRDLGSMVAATTAGAVVGARAGLWLDPHARRAWWRPALVTTFSFWICGIAFALLGGVSGGAFTVAALIVTGCVAGAMVASALADAGPDGRAVLVAVGIGAAAGTLATGLFLVPFAGLAAAALALAVLAFPAAVTVWPDLKKGAGPADNAGDYQPRNPE